MTLARKQILNAIFLILTYPLSTAYGAYGQDEVDATQSLIKPHRHPRPAPTVHPVANRSKMKSIGAIKAKKEAPYSLKVGILAKHRAK